jgi:hypothetical protein
MSKDKKGQLKPKPNKQLDPQQTLDSVLKRLYVIDELQKELDISPDTDLDRLSPQDKKKYDEALKNKPSKEEMEVALSIIETRIQDPKTQKSSTEILVGNQTLINSHIAPKVVEINQIEKVYGIYERVMLAREAEKGQSEFAKNLTEEQKEQYKQNKPSVQEIQEAITTFSAENKKSQKTKNSLPLAVVTEIEGTLRSELPGTISAGEQKEGYNKSKPSVQEIKEAVATFSAENKKLQETNQMNKADRIYRRVMLAREAEKGQSEFAKNLTEEQKEQYQRNKPSVQEIEEAITAFNAENKKSQKTKNSLPSTALTEIENTLRSELPGGAVELQSLAPQTIDIKREVELKEKEYRGHKKSDKEMGYGGKNEPSLTTKESKEELNELNVELQRLKKIELEVAIKDKAQAIRDTLKETGKAIKETGHTIAAKVKEKFTGRER